MHNMSLSLMFVDAPWKCAVTMPGRECMPGIAQNHPRHCSVGPLVTNIVQATQLHDAAGRPTIRKRGTSRASITKHEAVLDCVSCLIRGMGVEGCTARRGQQKIPSDAWGGRPEGAVLEVRDGVVGDT